METPHPKRGCVQEAISISSSCQRKEPLTGGVYTHPPVQTPCLFQGNQHGLLNEVSLYEAAKVFIVHSEIWKLEGTDGHFQGVLTAPPTPTIGGDMGPGQGNNAGAGVGDAPRQALFLNDVILPL